MAEYYIGIDVGYDKRRATTGLCLVTVDGTHLNWTCRNTGTQDTARLRDLKELIVPGTHISSIGIDGPLAPGLKTVKYYRAADALLSRGCFQKRCKPGQTSSPTGQYLHYHATNLAKLVLDLRNAEHLTLDLASHPSPVHQYRIVETFPNAFLAFLLAEKHIPQERLGRGKKSDEYWKIVVKEDYLPKLIEHLVPGCQLDNSLDKITNHDHRAAFICALAAMCVAKNKYVAVGEDNDGDFVMPPCELWGFDSTRQSRWAKTTLCESVAPVRRNRGNYLNHDNARVICNGHQCM